MPAFAAWRASTGSGDRAPGVDPRPCRIDVDAFELAAEHDRDAGEAGVGDEQVRTAADDEHRDLGRATEHAAAIARRSASRSARTSTASGPPQRYVVSGADGASRSTRPGQPIGERGGDAGDRGARHESRPEPDVGHGGEIAGAEGQHEVARRARSAPGPRRDRRGRGRYATGSAGWRSRTACRTRRPETPGIGVSPAGYTSVSTSASASVNASANCGPIEAVRE